jgi:hypothetical protein
MREQIGDGHHLDLAPATEEATETGRPDQLRREHDRIGTELGSDQAKGLTLRLSAIGTHFHEAILTIADKGA